MRLDTGYILPVIHFVELSVKMNFKHQKQLQMSVAPLESENEIINSIKIQILLCQADLHL